MSRTALLLLLIATPAWADDEARFDPARHMPKQTIAYAHFDVDAWQRGFWSLDVVQTLFDPRFAEFFKPTLDKIPTEQLKTMQPVRDWLDGHVAVGLCGLTVKVRRLDGKYEEVRLAPGVPLDERFLSLLLMADLQRDGKPWVLRPEGVAVVEAGPRLRDALDSFLQNPPIPCKHKLVQRGARQILSVEFEPFRVEGLWWAPEIHADVGGERWIIATSPDLLKAQATSLLDQPDFRAARERVTSGGRVAFSYYNAAGVLAVLEPFLPPFVKTSVRAAGIDSVRHVAAGVSMVDGGLRESVAVGLVENPKGVWRLLDAMPPGLKSVQAFDPSMAVLLAAKLDLRIFDERCREVLGALAPGAETVVQAAIEQALRPLDIDYRSELVPAFGDEIALGMFGQVVGLSIPELLAGVELRDEAAFGRLFTKLQAQLEAVPMQFREREFDDGGKGWQAISPFGNIFARVHAKHFLAGTNRVRLKFLVRSWGKNESSLARDGKAFRRTMQGLNGGATDDLCFLAYGDVQQWAPQALAFSQQMGVLDSDFFDGSKLPNVKHLVERFSGFAYGVRRDAKGIAIDSYGPVSLASAALLLGVLVEQRQGPFAIIPPAR
ncbi:MAG: hypothetical protein AAGD14_03190 [Planctomycetota bacterium]